MKADIHSPDADFSTWTKVIAPRSSLLDLRLKELWRYRDLISMFVRRDFVANFKQTLLGPLWFFLQPLLTTLTYIVIFGHIAKLSADELPRILFYLSGITIWNYFSETLNKTASVFRDNQSLFGKVYFPRLAMPISIVISNLLRFATQFLLFLIILFYFLLTGSQVQPNLYILLMPVLIIMMGMMGLGLGMIFSALTNKYKDLIFLLSFGVQLLMFATPIIYPIKSIPDQYKGLMLLNPISPIIEAFRYSFLGSGYFDWLAIGYSFACSLIILITGIIIFNKVQKTFSDIV